MTDSISQLTQNISNMSINTRCSAITSKKVQCKRNRSNNKHDMCTFHFNILMKPKEKMSEKKIEYEDCVCCCEPVKTKLVCGHDIHLKCVAMTGLAKCPLCRAEVEITSYKGFFKSAVLSNKVHQYHIYYLPLTINNFLTFNNFNSLDDLTDVCGDVGSKKIIKSIRTNAKRYAGLANYRKSLH